MKIVFKSITKMLNLLQMNVFFLVIYENLAKVKMKYFCLGKK